VKICFRKSFSYSYLRRFFNIRRSVHR